MTQATQGDDATSFPPGFRWGAATAAYQIEGAVAEDGRGQSIWDTFSHTPGKVRGGDTGDVACDSYHRYREDIGLLVELGVSVYRFSVAWPRIQPGGKGPVNQKGLDFYRALVDELRDHDIAPACTLYHWDLPQELEDAGGWTVRATAERYAEYAAIVAESLGDAVEMWITLNEPQVSANNGYRTGEHAPGRTDPAAAAAAAHHLLVGHGLATTALREILPAGTAVGVTLDLHPIRGLGEDIADSVAIADAESNGLFLEPVLHGSYPAAARQEALPAPELVLDGDLELICRPIDFLGVNYYSPAYLRRGDWSDLRRNESPHRGLPGIVNYKPEDTETTCMGWLIDPTGLYEVLARIERESPGLRLYVTENGCAAEDYLDPNGVVNDLERVKYLHTHLDACAQAIRDGVNLGGYFVWSLLDNFEWGWGYQKRFGVIFVDFSTQKRTIKQSGHFYAGVVANNAVPALPATWPR